MNFFPHPLKNARSFLFIKPVIITLVILSACKNDNDDILPEPYPVFGTCEAVNTVGNLSITSEDGKNFVYKTHGGGKVAFSTQDPQLGFTHDDYPIFEISFWGGVYYFNHENLNGKHIKDRLGNRRSLIFPDGAKITTVYEDNFGPLLSVSIIEGNAFHHINFACNTVEYSSTNSPYAKQLDDAEADGETSTFEFTETGLLYLNIYIEDVAGQKVEERVPLGELFKDDPKKINDYFDDPRLGHT